MWDGEKYYEYFDLDRAMYRARMLGMTLVVVMVCNNFWRGPRLLQFGRCATARALYASRGLPAGDTFNDAFVRAYAPPSFARFVARNPSVSLSSYVDDDTVMAHGPEAELLDNLEAAALDMSAVSKDELGFGLSMGKLVSVASNQALANKLAARLGVLGGNPPTSSLSLIHLFRCRRRG